MGVVVKTTETHPDCGCCVCFVCVYVLVCVCVREMFCVCLRERRYRKGRLRKRDEIMLRVSSPTHTLYRPSPHDPPRSYKKHPCQGVISAELWLTRSTPDPTLLLCCFCESARLSGKSMAIRSMIPANKHVQQETE